MTVPSERWWECVGAMIDEGREYDETGESMAEDARACLEMRERLRDFEESDAEKALDLSRGALQVVVDENNDLRALVRRAATSSTVTTSDDPGCFYCDGAEGRHYSGCQAAAALGERPTVGNHAEHNPATCPKCANAAEIAELNNF